MTEKQRARSLVTLFALVVTALIGPRLGAGEDTAKKTRAYLGVIPEPVPVVLSLHLELEGGVLIRNIFDESPAARAGLRKLDVVTRVDGEAVDSVDGFIETIRSHEPGERIALDVVRGKKALRLDVELGAYSEGEGDAPAEEDVPPLEVDAGKRRGFLGIRLEPVPAIVAEHLELEADRGAVVAEVFEGSAAEKADIHPMDILVKLDGQSFRHDQLGELLLERHEGDVVRLELLHRGKPKEIEVKLGPRPVGFAVPQLHPPGGGEWLEIQPPRAFPGDPHHPRFRGKLFFKGQDGDEHIIDIPEWEGKIEAWRKNLERELEKHLSREEIEDTLEDMKARLEDLGANLRRGVEELDLDVELPGVRIGPGVSREGATSSSHRAVIRHLDGDFDITVEDVDGRRTVTVLRAGEELARDLPIEELETLPRDVRKRVEAVMEELPKVDVKGRVKAVPKAVPDTPAPPRGPKTI